MNSVPGTMKPHALCIPYPAQGHINPMLKLAKLLHHRGFHITFVNTENMHERVLKAQGANSLKGLSDFRFETIPDGLPPSDNPRDFAALCDSISKNCLVPFQELVTNLNSPPVSCIVSDGAMSFTLEVAEEVTIPNVLFWTVSACGFMGYLQFPHIINSGLLPTKGMDLNRYLDTPINFISGVQDIRLRDIPTYIRTTDPKDKVLNYLLGEIQNTSRADAVILNTFDGLEHEVLGAIESLSPPIYTIGALHLLVNQIAENRTNLIECSLWKEETNCLQWLSSKKPNSVVYVNFGSIAIMTPEQIYELAWGLSDSEQNFLWAVRPDVVSSESPILSSEFIAETRERGLVSSWCPQEQVLSHPSTSCFVTHSGWNSTIESLCGGVPMICRPFGAEQQMNCRYSCRHWGIGVEVDADVKRAEWSSLVRELVEGGKGKKMKMKAMEWKTKAGEATAPSGSSYVKLDKLVNEILMH